MKMERGEMLYNQFNQPHMNKTKIIAQVFFSLTYGETLDPKCGSN